MAPTPHPALSTRDLLASCAAASAVSTPPGRHRAPDSDDEERSSASELLPAVRSVDHPRAAPDAA
ncbi:hypothetical protein [Streptomyces sp. NPDC006879]|uniref:hypothetical protein n=1 Tax=Streptomyces sp. NPDC006879 TaxID=3364767 RepID=UPI0036997A4D